MNRTVMALVVAAILVAIALCGLEAWNRLRYKPNKGATCQNYRAIIVPCVSKQRSMASHDRSRWVERAQSLVADGSEHSALELARMYSTGDFALGIHPDPDSSTKLCRTVLLYGSDPEAKKDARWRLFEDSSLAMHQRIVDGMPPSSTRLPDTLADDMILGIIAKKRREERSSQQSQPVHAPARRVMSSPPPQTTTPPRIMNDAHNVHDSGIIGSARRRLQALPHAPESCRDSIETYIETDECDVGDDETKALALHALDTLSTDVHDSLLGMSEMDAASRVWYSVSNDSNGKDRVVYALASSIEHGMPVCTTGKISRLAASLSSPEDMKPVWAIKQQLYAVASDVRNSCIESASQHDRDQYLYSDESPLRMRMINRFEAKAREVCSDLPDSVSSPIIQDATNNL